MFYCQHYNLFTFNNISGIGQIIELLYSTLYKNKRNKYREYLSIVFFLDETLTPKSFLIV